MFDLIGLSLLLNSPEKRRCYDGLSCEFETTTECKECYRYENKHLKARGGIITKPVMSFLDLHDEE